MSQEPRLEGGHRSCAGALGSAEVLGGQFLPASLSALPSSPQQVPLPTPGSPSPNPSFYSFSRFPSPSPSGRTKPCYS